MSFLIFKMSDIEITKDKIMFICMASCGRNNINKNGVAMIEKPKPVLVCKTDATNIIHIKINAICQNSPPLSFALMLIYVYFNINCSLNNLVFISI
ncbi:hypothetical protein TMU01_26920 [Tenuibacillus multivorans]|nr:hypothetical protein TMU01_26920 [Tenuibacillus multivorans]